MNDKLVAKSIKHGKFSKFMTNLIGDPHHYGDELITYIQEYKTELIDFIPKTTYLEAIIIACGEAGADWMLCEKIIDDEIINKLLKKMYKGKISSSLGKKRKSLTALLYIEQAQNRKLMDDDLISLIVTDVQREAPAHKTKWTSRDLAEIELFRKDGKMIQHIIQNYDGWAFNYLTGMITWDDRIYDFLIKGLDEPWWFGVATDFFKTEYHPDKGIIAAEALLKIGKEHGIHKVILKSAEIHYSDNEKILTLDRKTVDWCARNYEFLSDFIFDYLDTDDIDIRFYIVLVLAAVRDEKCVAVLETLKDDPNKGIRLIVKEALKKV